MDKEINADIEKIKSNKKLYEKFGALQFKKFVLLIEKMKFKVIDKFFSNIGDWYSKRCERKVTKLCNKNITEEEKNRIRFDYNCRKLAFKKELIEKKNRNYHFDTSNAGSFYKYLLWNKNIHKKGIRKDIIGIVLSILGIFFLNGVFIPVVIITLLYSSISLVVDFECVNLQNYNLCRFYERKDVLDKIEERKKKRDIDNYSNVSKKVYEQLEKSVESPKSSDVVDSLTTVEQLRELRKLALEIRKKREDIDVSSKVKK